MSEKPAETPPLPETTVDLLIPHPDAPQALLVGNDQHGWRLPSVPGMLPWHGELPQMLEAVHERFGMKVALLRSAASPLDVARKEGRFAYELDNLSAAVGCPPGARWVDQAALGGLALATPERLELLQHFLHALEHGERARRSPPWSRPGWLSEACGWIAEQLQGLGRPLIAPVEQIKCWSISSVLRGYTTKGEVYFKASADLPLFVDEPSITAALAHLYPEHIPMPLCIDAERRWMLLDTFDQIIGHDGSEEQKVKMLQLFGRIQRDSARHCDHLLAAGCLDRRLEVLAVQIAALAADTPALIGLNEAELAGFRALVPALQQQCAELAECGLPPTLVHGDLHLNNVGIKDGHYQVFDWTDACIAHPLLDLNVVYREKDMALQERLRDAYLTIWADELPQETLLRAYALAQPLFELHQGVTAWQINANLEDAALVDFTHITAHIVRSVLKQVASSLGSGQQGAKGSGHQAP